MIDLIKHWLNIRPKRLADTREGRAILAERQERQRRHMPTRDLDAAMRDLNRSSLEGFVSSRNRPFVARKAAPSPRQRFAGGRA